MSNKPIWFGLFSYSLTERRGLFLLFLLLFLLKLLPILREWNRTSQAVPPEIQQAFLNEIDSLFVASEEKVQPKSTSYSSQPKSKKAIQPDYFDPNQVSQTTLTSWNVPGKLVKTWINYREAGGYFKKADDLRKLYQMTEENYAALAPFVRFSANGDSQESTISETHSYPSDSLLTTKRESAHKREKTWEPTVIDINQSKAEDWNSLPGIGPTYAGRILRFREALGGFSSIDQIGETWNLPDSVFQKIKPWLQASPPLQKININKSEADALASHPYLNAKQARIICRYRNNYGPFKDTAGLTKTGVINEKDIEKLTPYLQF
ncbi:MAG: helix-hairpin-helix domain-containing protein [Bacteroidetes bacterium]|nr:helix-hairpin-helix domain-containing protein [Bacteroidota bacterium]